MAEKYGKKVRELMIKETESLFDNKGFIFSTFENIKASEIDKFRRDVRGAGSRHFIVKKRLAKIALNKKGLSELGVVFDQQKNVGATVIEDDPVAIAKLLANFAKSNKNFKLESGCLEGRVLGAERVKELADLPGREQLLAMVLSAMNGPVTGFVGVLSALLKNICYAINAIKEKKESGN